MSGEIVPRELAELYDTSDVSINVSMESILQKCLAREGSDIKFSDAEKKKIKDFVVDTIQAAILMRRIDGSHHPDPIEAFHIIWRLLQKIGAFSADEIKAISQEPEWVFYVKHGTLEIRSLDRNFLPDGTERKSKSQSFTEPTVLLGKNI
jgi:hypothetical protein